MDIYGFAMMDEKRLFWESPCCSKLKLHCELRENNVMLVPQHLMWFKGLFWSRLNVQSWNCHGFLIQDERSNGLSLRRMASGTEGPWPLYPIPYEGRNKRIWRGRMSCDPQLPRFISVSYEVGSRCPDLHTFTLTQRVKNQYLSGRKVPNRQKYGWQAQSI